MTDTKKIVSRKRKETPKSSLVIKKESSKVSTSTKRSRNLVKSAAQNNSDTNKSKSTNNITKNAKATKKTVKKTIDKTGKKDQVLNSKNVKSKAKINKLPKNIIKRNTSLTAKAISKNEQIKNKNIDKMNNCNLMNLKCKKETCNMSKMEKLPISATSLTAKKNAVSDIKCEELNIRTPIRSNSKLSSTETSPYKESGTGLGDLIRTPVNIVSSALRKVTRIFKN